MLDQWMVDDYLSRIGARRPDEPDIAALRHLQERHVMSVPFEDIDYHVDGTHIHMDERIIDKIVYRRRGGGCYETNPALGFLLEALGFAVEILPGRVYRPEGLGPPMCHLTLRVRLDGVDWLVDTGFGKNSTLPLRLDSRAPQDDPAGSYQFADAADERIDLYRNGKPIYQLDQRPCELADFGPTLWWWRTCADSPFRRELFCVLPTEDGRVTLKGATLTTISGSERTVEQLTGEQEIRAAYRKHFGIELDTLPTDPAADERGESTADISRRYP